MTALWALLRGVPLLVYPLIAVFLWGAEGHWSASHQKRLRAADAQETRG